MTRRSCAGLAGLAVGVLPAAQTLVLIAQHPSRDAASSASASTVAAVVPAGIVFVAAALLLLTAKGATASGWSRPVQASLFCYSAVIVATAAIDAPLVGAVAGAGAVVLWSVSRLSPSVRIHFRRRLIQSVLGTLALSVFTIVLNPAWAGYGDSSGDLGTRLHRLAGIMPQPNTLGAVSGLALLVLLTSRRRVPVRALGICLAVATLGLSWSFTAWAAVGAAIAVNLLPRLRRYSVAVRGAHALLLAGLLYMTAMSTSLEALQPDGSTSVDDRRQLWGLVADTWTEHPLFGHGPTFWGEQISAGNVETWGVHAHNQAYNTLQVHGLLGAGALAWLLLALARDATRGAGKVAGAMLVFLVVRSLTEIPFDFTFGGLNLVALAVLLASPSAATVIPSVVRQRPVEAVAA